MNAVPWNVDFPEESFDVILSSLAFHYVADYENLIKIYRMLKAGGNFVFTVEHPVFLLLMEHKTGIITKKEKYCISRWTIIMRETDSYVFGRKGYKIS